MFTFERVLTLLGTFSQVLGLLVFGLTSGWFTLFAFRQPERKWQLQALVYGVYLVFVAAMARFTTPGGYGAFLIGATAAFLFWGVFKKKAADAEEE